MKERRDIPKLKPHERAFELDTGEAVAVAVSRSDHTGDYIAVKIWPRVVDAATGETTCECPAEVLTIQAAAIADGQVSLESAVADRVAEMCEKARRVKAARDAFFRLPAADS
jgi:hypothetical protein